MSKKRNIRVVHLGKYYPPDKGGIENVTQNIAEGIASKRFLITVICFKSTKIKKNKSPPFVRILRAPVLATIKSQPIGIRYFFLCLYYIKRSDIVHLHAPNLLASMSILFLNKKTRLITHWHSDIINKGLLEKIVAPLQNILLNKSDTILVTSKAYFNSSKTLAPYKNKIDIVPIGIPDISVGIKNHKLPLDLEKKIEGKKIILSVGRLVHYKGFELLIHASKFLSPNTIIIIAGNGPLKMVLKNLVLHTKSSDRILLLNKISTDHLHALYKKASLFCLPSINRSEAFGVVLLEALAFGLPIISTKIKGSGTSWVNKHEETGLVVKNNDSKSIALACNRILNSKSLRNKFSKGSRKRYLQLFTIKKFLNRIRGIYNKLAFL